MQRLAECCNVISRSWPGAIRAMCPALPIAAAGASVLAVLLAFMSPVTGVFPPLEYEYRKIFSLANKLFNYLMLQIRVINW